MDREILQDFEERAKYLATLTEIGVDRAAFKKPAVEAGSRTSSQAQSGRSGVR